MYDASLALTSLVDIVLACAYDIFVCRTHDTVVLADEECALGHDDDFVTRNAELPHRLADDGLAETVGVRVGRVPRVDAAVIGRLEKLQRGVLVEDPLRHLWSAERHCTQDGPRDSEARGAELDVVNFGRVERLLQGRGNRDARHGECVDNRSVGGEYEEMSMSCHAIARQALLL